MVDLAGRSITLILNELSLKVTEVRRHITGYIIEHKVTFF